jgi:hypothetical protein
VNLLGADNGFLAEPFPLPAVPALVLVLLVPPELELEHALNIAEPATSADP